MNNPTNPWLSIPASDYEAHMGEEGAQQLSFLGDVFRKWLERHRPEKVAVLGCATGNGFEHIDFDKLKLLVGIDINPEYLEIARERFAHRTPNLQLFCTDIKNIELVPRSFDFISCGLFFEHVDPKMVIAKISRWLKPGAVFGTVLQLPEESGRSVSETGIASLSALESFSTLISPETLAELVDTAGFQCLDSEECTLATGKSFFVASYRFED